MTWFSYPPVAQVARLPQITLCVRNTKSKKKFCVFYYLRNVGSTRHSRHSPGGPICGDLQFDPQYRRVHTRTSAG